MNEQEAFKIFVERIGRPEEPYRDGFREIWGELTMTDPYSRGVGSFGRICVNSLDLLVQWYGDEHADHDRKRDPLRVIETYRRPRAWVIFFEWSHDPKS